MNTSLSTYKSILKEFKDTYNVLNDEKSNANNLVAEKILTTCPFLMYYEIEVTKDKGVIDTDSCLVSGDHEIIYYKHVKNTCIGCEHLKCQGCEHTICKDINVMRIIIKNNIENNK